MCLVVSIIPHKSLKFSGKKDCNSKKVGEVIINSESGLENKLESNVELEVRKNHSC